MRCLDEAVLETGDPSTWDNCVCPLPCSNQQYSVQWSKGKNVIKVFFYYFLSLSLLTFPSSSRYNVTGQQMTLSTYLPITSLVLLLSKISSISLLFCLNCLIFYMVKYLRGMYVFLHNNNNNNKNCFSWTDSFPTWVVYWQYLWASPSLHLWNLSFSYSKFSKFSVSISE